MRNAWWRWWGLGLVVLAAAACDTDSTPTAGRPSRSAKTSATASLPDTASAQSATGSSAPAPMLAARPYELVVPAGAGAGKPLPLLMVLHGLGASGRGVIRQLGLRRFANDKKLLIVAPDGTKDSQGRRFWHATDACCDFDGAGVRDVEYLDAVLGDISRRHQVDERRVFVMGFSNGAFMAHRLACERSERFAAIAALSGVSWVDSSRCRPTAAVAILQVHGDADKVVSYGGGHLFGRPDRPRHPSVRATMSDWAKAQGCDVRRTESGPLAMRISELPTTRMRYTDCPRGAVELWTVQGGGHTIGMDPASIQATYRFLMAHPKPTP